MSVIVKYLAVESTLSGVIQGVPSKKCCSGCRRWWSFQREVSETVPDASRRALFGVALLFSDHHEQYPLRTGTLYVETLADSTSRSEELQMEHSTKLMERRTVTAPAMHKMTEGL